MDLSTKYLGLELKHPLVVGASPLVDDLDQVKRIEDAGAAAIVMHSLFEEQLLLEDASRRAYVESYENGNAEALSFFPKPDEFALGPDEYLEQIRKVKAVVSTPVIGSLNGVTNSGWLDYASRIEQAGADALELNVYSLPTNPSEDAAAIERRLVEMVRRVKKAIRIPLAVKLSSFITSPVHFGAQLEKAGADGLVVFNRFYQPDIDVEQLEVRYSLDLSTSSELRLRLRWLAVLSAKLGLSLGCTGGVHSATDAIKAVMAGAHAVQAVSAILQNGPTWLSQTRDEMALWLESREYESLNQAQGSMNLARCPEPAAYERGNYMRVLRGWVQGSIGT